MGRTKRGGALDRARPILRAAASAVVVTLMTAGILATTAAPAAADITSPTPRPDAWVTNGRVNAIVQNGGHLYIGGQFTTVGPNTGHGVFLDDRTGTVLPGSPSVNGNVLDAVPDGAGGVYIVGEFNAVNGVPRGFGAHVLADGALGVWDPKANGAIRRIVTTPWGRVLGGDFTKLGGIDRIRLALVDSTGFPRAWRADVNGPVHALALSPDGARLFVGGSFGVVGGNTRRNVAAITLATGAVEPWAPQPNGIVHAIALSAQSTRVYLGGTFTAVGIVPRNRLAAVDYATGVVDAVWQANVDGGVFALAVSPSDHLFIGGRFGKIKNVGRSNVGAVNFDGAILPWSPTATDAVVDIALTEAGTAWLAGPFTSVRFVQRMFLAHVDMVAGGLVSGIDPFAASASRVVVPLGDGRVFFGGDFASVNTTKRAHLARIDVATGRLDPTFMPVLDGPVNALEVSEDGSTLYVGGRFSVVNGVGRRHGAALGLPGGHLTAFNPDIEGFEVLAIDQKGDRVLLGGQFNGVRGLPIANVARVDPATGAPNASFSPNPNGAVRDVDVLPDNGVILAGDFTRLALIQNRSYLAHVGPNGAVQPWNPRPPSFVVEGILSADGATYFAALIGQGGLGNAVEAYTRAGVGARLWRTEGDGDVQAIALAPDGETIYAGGHFFRIFATGTSTQIDTRNRAMALSTSNGALLPWAPPLDFAGSGVFAMLATTDALYLGGDFARIGSVSSQGLAFFPGVP